MGCGRKKPTYGTKKVAQTHGAITYGSGNYSVYKVKGGYRARKR